MKILHTSDWHLGHTLYNYDRSCEQQSFLHQLTDIVAHEQPDALLISGDIYHYSTPSATTQRMYTDAMLEIHQACPDMTIVVTAGNHDSSSKLEVDSNLWSHFQVHVVGSIERMQEEVNLKKHIIEVQKGGVRKGYVIAVPHVYPQNFPALNTETPRERRLEAFFQALTEEVKRINIDGLPVVLMAHLSVEGSDRMGHDESIGGIEFVPLTSLGDGYDYLALGHIHCPQDIKGSHHRARFCGTPIPVSFDETYPHSVSLVEVAHEEEPQIHTIKIDNPIPLVTLPQEPLPIEEALKLLEAYPANKPAYIRLNVSANDYLPPDCNERASHIAKQKACRYCYIKLTREQTDETDNARSLTIQEMRQLSPLEIARLYYKENMGKEMDEELCELMRTVIQHITCS